VQQAGHLSAHGLGLGELAGRGEEGEAAVVLDRLGFG
jgi:hypothetical protein